MIRASATSLLLFLVLFIGPLVSFGQNDEKTPSSLPESQEISEAEGVPVLVKHLPDWKNKQKQAVFTTTKEKITETLGNRTILETVDFVGGTEAVIANYAQGKLLIVEYPTPQASADTDKKVNEKWSQRGSGIFYRRIGNYNVFLFDGQSEASANQLFDQIKYEKVVQWLGTNPFLYRQQERVIVGTFSGVFVSTVLAIILGLGFSAVIGFFVGLIYFKYTDGRRESMEAFSDAGGMTRLNLDELSEDFTKKLL